MAREHWRDHEDDRQRISPRDRDDFGQADYSSDYAYDPRSRTGYRADEQYRGREDYGQADYSSDFSFDAARGRPYRRFSSDDPAYDDRGHDRDGDGYPDRGRSWMDKAGDFLAGRPHPAERGGYRDLDRDGRDDRREAAERRDIDERRERDTRRRRGPSDRVLEAVIIERLEDRRIDLREVDVSVRDGEVTLNGTVRRKEDKRRIEDLVDIDGVRYVQNNLRYDIDRRWRLI